MTQQAHRIRRSLRRAGLVAVCTGAAVLIPAAAAAPALLAPGGALAASATPTAPTTAASASSIGAASAGTAAPGTGGPAGPQLTVVGFGVMNILSPPAPQAAAGQPPVININLAVNAATAAAALSRLGTAAASLRAKLRQAGIPAAAVTEQGPPNLNANAGANSYQAGVSVLVASASLAVAAGLIDRLRLDSNPNVSNVWVDTGTPSGTPSAHAVTAAYATAFAQAEATALLLAAADHLTLGPQVAVSEGASAQSESCSTMGGCSGALTPGLDQPPLVGPGKQMVAVTVTYATTPRSS